MNRLKNVICFALSLSAMSGNQLFADLILTENGNTAYRIVLPSHASDNLKYAVHELKIHLEEASGAKFAITGTGTNNAEQIILRELDPELKTGEFSVRTEGKNLLLSGGGESGIHHAVHDFLANDCGYIWYDARGGRKVPDLKNFRLPEISRRKSFEFADRTMSSDWFFYRPKGHYFLYRSGMNSKVRLFPLPGMKQNEKLNIKIGVNDVRRASPAAHTFFDYIPDVPGKSRIGAFRKKGYFKEHPEWFSMNQQGKRIVRQLCFSNPDLRAEFKKNFYEHIRMTPNSNIFSVTAYDFPGEICHCKECQAAVKKYKTNGAPVFLFVKELAEAAAKDFPNIMIWTYAYRKEQTEFPPIGLNLPDNVIVNFCPIDDDMSKDWTADTNAETYRNLKEWKKHCRNIWIGYYVNPWTFSVLMPPAVGNVYRLGNDIALGRKAGANGFGFSHPNGTPSMTGFTELQSYLISRLMRDPGLAIDPLIDDFMQFEYGPAAPLMRKYLNELEKVAKETRVFVKWNAVHGVWNSFFKSADAVRWQGYFDEMEKLTASQPELLFSVQRVRIPLDVMTLRFYSRIKREVPSYPTGVKELAARITSVYDRATGAFYSVKEPQIKMHRENHRKGVARLVDNWTVQAAAEPKSLPKEIFGKIDPALIFEFFPETYRKSVRIEDPQAAWNYTVYNDREVLGFPIQHLKYDSAANIWKDVSKINAAKPGMEGKYCFYHFGKTAISPSYEMRFHFDGYKHFARIFPGEVWMPGTDDTVDVYVSLKLTGPKFYPGSKEKDSIACDRIVIVRKTND